MEEIICPDWWLSTLDDVEDTLKTVKKGSVSEIARSAGGRPLYKVEYGKSNAKPGSANCSSALGAHDINYFVDKRGTDYIPTVFLGGAIHGAEFEGTVAVLNLIKEIETGTDYAGRTHPELMGLINKVHLIIIPVCNPDGRARIPFRSFLGRTFYDLRYYNQGTWKKDGTLCGWPGCKMIHPMKEASEFLGAYFNDDGYNLMHEDYFGKASNESSAILDICRNDAPDFSVLLHGGTNSQSGIIVPKFTTKTAEADGFEISNILKERNAALGINYKVYPLEASCEALSLQTAMHHLCGGVAVNYESNQGLIDAPGEQDTADQIHTAHILLFEEICKYVLRKFNKIQ